MTEIEKIKEEIKKLQSRIEELEKQQENPVVWTPKEGEKVYVLCSDGDIICEVFYENYVSDQKKLNYGNIFSTQEEAEWEREHRKVLWEMKAYTKEFVHGENNYSIYYNYDNGYMGIEGWMDRQYNVLYFESKAKAQACINAIGEERLKKYYFNVKE